MMKWTEGDDCCELVVSLNGGAAHEPACEQELLRALLSLTPEQRAEIWRAVPEWQFAESMKQSLQELAARAEKAERELESARAVLRDARDLARWAIGGPLFEAYRFVAGRILAATEHLTPAVSGQEPAGERINWQCSGCRFGFIGKWQKVCPNCKREDYWCGSVSPDAKLWQPAPSEQPPVGSRVRITRTDKGNRWHAGDTGTVERAPYVSVSGELMLPVLLDRYSLLGAGTAVRLEDVERVPAAEQPPAEEKPESYLLEAGKLHGEARALWGMKQVAAMLEVQRLILDHLASVPTRRELVEALVEAQRRVSGPTAHALEIVATVLSGRHWNDGKERSDG